MSGRLEGRTTSPQVQHAAFADAGAGDGDAAQVWEGGLQAFGEIEAEHLKRRILEARLIVQQGMIEPSGNLLQGSVEEAKVVHPTRRRLRRAPKRSLHSERMAVQARIAVVRLAARQAVSGVEGGGLRDLELGCQGMPRYLCVCRLKRQRGCSRQ